MIHAAEALRLPTAKFAPLSVEEMEAADKIEGEIDKAVRAHMQWNGLNIQVRETRASVIAEVSMRLMAADYSAHWQAIVEPHKLNRAQSVHIGFGLSLSPTDDAYKAATSTVS